MRTVLLFLLLVQLTFSKKQQYDSFNLSDKTQIVTNDSFACKKQASSNLVFIARGYKTNGVLDRVGVQNLVNAQSVGFLPDVTIEPCTSCSASGAAQALTLVNYTKSQNITIRQAWIDFMGTTWSSDIARNRQVVIDMGKQFDAQNVIWGVKSDATHWLYSVEANWTVPADQHKPLWWPWGNGDYDNTPETYVAFGGWKSPSMHTFDNEFDTFCPGLGLYDQNIGQS